MKDGYWTRIDQEKANTFAEYLVKVFIPFNTKEMGLEKEEAVFDRRESNAKQ